MTERFPCKRPNSQKDLSYFLSFEPEHDISNQKENNQWNFSQILSIYSNATNQGSELSNELIESFKSTIIFLQKLKNEVIKKHKLFEESHISKINNNNRAPVRLFLRNSSSNISNSLSNSNSRNQIKKIKKSDSFLEVPRQYSISSLWNLTQKLLSNIPTVENFKKILSKINIDNSIPDLGPHYSLKINDYLRDKHRDPVIIRIPTTFASPTITSNTSPSIVYHRLLSSFLPLSNENIIEKNTPLKEIYFFKQNDDVIFPVDTCGTSNYSIIPFDEKLLFEINSLMLFPDKTIPCQMDNEVMLEIIELKEEYKKLLNHTNLLRENILNILIKNENEIIRRSLNIKKWIQFIEKTDPSKKNIGRPKSRGKTY